MRAALAFPPSRIPCQGTDKELWFSDRPEQQKQAAALCITSCPIAKQCREAGRATRARWGVWGGERPAQRRNAGYISNSKA
ncbi:WhiB family transcriptional regulator [Streptomyces sioyaensis]|uniref:WhiB family transcriptional regulator n=1 Tax=Streptomyces sioyaensis TaxID=67364 RepID=UPI0033D9D43C